MPKPLSLLTCVTALALASAVFGQQETAPDQDPASGTNETTDALNRPDCEGDFRNLDTDGNGFISEQESAREHARAAIDGVQLSQNGLGRDDYLRLCNSQQWSQTTPEAGAPFEGENSFTEEQARERAVAWNVTEVSALVLDERGIWRGTGRVSGNEVQVAVDYRGNVVTTPTAN